MRVQEKPALSILKAETASEFCSSFLNLEPQTTSTTIYPSTTIATTLVRSVTETTTVPLTLEEVSFSTSTTTATITTMTSYARDGGPVNKRTVSFPDSGPTTPAGLEEHPSSAISTACLCYITTPSSIPTETITFTSAYTSFSSATSDLTVSTVTESTTVATSTTTTVVPAQTTTIAWLPNGRSFTFVQTYTNHCVPINYQTWNVNLSFPTYVTPSFEYAFQWCAAKCQNTAGCTQVWVGYDGGNWFDCITGMTGTYGWDASEVQCEYPPVQPNTWWFDVAVPN
ncbi:hypothetical protein B0T14DRAFT_561828 [Immersiella caudata]|uniref:Uncharacterized protein n=1 Tax=Immersiella caudata TaxID=314043 RepID=A0AA39X230_9PEZI|nr:hypothetical protein B0T14DRAFT_561828 [Immersiella caudata]